MLLSVLVAAALVGLGVDRIVGPDAGTTGSNASGPVVGSANPVSAGSAVASIASQVDPALVDVTSMLGYQGGQAAGTGLVLTPSGEVVTNNHVISGATSITVTDVGTGRSYPATVVGYDRTDDIAILHLQGASGLRTVSVAQPARVSVGDAVIAIGNAGGVGGTPTAVAGSVTGLDSTVTASDDSGGSEQLTGLIQVAADVAPGDSGGPLVNSQGQVVGIDTAASVGPSPESAGGDGYAIPIARALAVGRQIEAGTGSDVIHIGPTGFLGVSVTDAVPPGWRRRDGSGGAAGSPGGGAAVAGVVDGGPAQLAGLVPGDVVVALDGRSVNSASALTNLMIAHHPGDSVTLTWLDQAGQQQSAAVQLAAGPPN